MHDCRFDKPRVELEVIKVLPLLNLQALLVELLAGTRQALVVLVLLQPLLAVLVPGIVHPLPGYPLYIFPISCFQSRGISLRLARLEVILEVGVYRLRIGVARRFDIGEGVIVVVEVVVEVVDHVLKVVVVELLHYPSNSEPRNRGDDCSEETHERNRRGDRQGTGTQRGNREAFPREKKKREKGETGKMGKRAGRRPRRGAENSSGPEKTRVVTGRKGREGKGRGGESRDRGGGGVRQYQFALW